MIGPQGVCEEADVTGTHEQDWLGYEATGERVEFRVVIFFPWDPEQRLFTGEKVHVDERLGRSQEVDTEAGPYASRGDLPRFLA